MRALLDTCAISELQLPRPHPGVREAIEAFDSDDLFLSVLTIGEIAKGIAVLPDGRKKRGLQTWLQTLERFYSGRILPVDLETGRIWGEITAAAQKIGKTVPAADGLIAATARRHGLHVMTRNVDHFEATGTLLINPWVD